MDGERKSRESVQSTHDDDDDDDGFSIKLYIINPHILHFLKKNFRNYFFCRYPMLKFDLIQ